MKKIFHTQGPCNIKTETQQHTLYHINKNTRIVEKLERIQTRKINRRFAKMLMKSKGIVHIAKRQKTGSYFASNWREYAG